MSKLLRALEGLQWEDKLVIFIWEILILHAMLFESSYLAFIIPGVLGFLLSSNKMGAMVDYMLFELECPRWFIDLLERGFYYAFETKFSSIMYEVLAILTIFLFLFNRINSYYVIGLVTFSVGTIMGKVYFINIVESIEYIEKD